ncbi:MAG: arginine deiminase [Prevotellaceae bacterium]|jgi:arginine deiminase|nr:arginine deiminase [Prevotellaceae bacterium]
MARKTQKTMTASTAALRGGGAMPLTVEVQSEIGELEAVIIHTPGAEVENMTPKHAQRALYSDILNLPLAQKEYAQIEQVLSMVAQTFQLKDLLVKVLENHSEKVALVERICRSENVTDYFDDLINFSPNKLATCLIEGLPARIDNLTAFLNDDYYALFPLYNFYFTRDASMVIGRQVLIGQMANRVRLRESLIMDAIFRNKKLFTTSVINPCDDDVKRPEALIEGGDVLVARDDVLLVGNGSRTSSQGIDFILSQLCIRREEGRKYVLVQQLPDMPESFIHLDMVFTFLDKDACMVFEPLILEDNRYETVLITVDNGRVARIKYVPDLLSGLKRLGIDLEPLICGGREDEWTQEREQWHSGANFFAFAPGKVISYARNLHTIDELAKHGFEVIPASAVTSKAALKKPARCVVTIDGSELPRGGGGARCMTMPLRRKPVKWNA